MTETERMELPKKWRKVLKGARTMSRGEALERIELADEILAASGLRVADRFRPQAAERE